MSNPAVETLKSLVDPTQLLAALGFTVYYDNDIEIRGPCAIHGGDNKSAFCIRKEHNRFYCYTHGCHLDSSGDVNNDIVSLVMKVRNCSFMEAIKFLCELTGFNFDEANVDDEAVHNLKKKKDREKFIRGITGNKRLPELSETLVEKYTSLGARYFKSIGIEQEQIDFFELGTMVDDMGVERGAVPIRDDKGRLVSISGRRADGDEEPRYLLIKEFKKRKVLYNLHIAKEFRDMYSSTVIIVEGFKAVWHVYKSGYPNVVAVMGSVINPEQINLLIKHGFSNCLLMLDGDEPGRKGMPKSLLLLDGKLETRPVYLPQDISPDDVSVDELRELISTFMF